MFSLFDFATILPHIAIPIILYYVPSFHYATNDVIVVILLLICLVYTQIGWKGEIGIWECWDFDVSFCR